MHAEAIKEFLRIWDILEQELEENRRVLIEHEKISLDEELSYLKGKINATLELMKKIDLTIEKGPNFDEHHTKRDSEND